MKFSSWETEWINQSILLIGLVNIFPILRLKRILVHSSDMNVSKAFIDERESQNQMIIERHIMLKIENVRIIKSKSDLILKLSKS